MSNIKKFGFIVFGIIFISLDGTDEKEKNVIADLRDWYAVEVRIHPYFSKHHRSFEDMWNKVLAKDTVEGYNIFLNFINEESKKNPETNIQTCCNMLN